MSDKTSNCSHNCSTCQEKCEERKTDFSFASNSLSNVKNVICVVSGKGGVGKSLVTSMLSVLVNKKGYKTAVLDGDITGSSITKVFGIHNQEVTVVSENTMLPVETKEKIKLISTNLFLKDETDPVVWRGPVLGNVIKEFWSNVAWSDVDYMFVDMPPGTGDVPLTVFQSLPVKGIVIVTTPQDLVSGIVVKAIKMAKMMNINILGIVENMSYFECDSCHKKHYIYGESNLNEITNEYNIDTLSRLPIDPQFAKLCDEGNIELLNNDSLLEDIVNKICSLK